MNKEQSEALEASINKWKGNVKAAKKNPLEVAISISSCPLCILYYSADCEGCPILIKTGQVLCRDTPYHDVVKYRNIANARIKYMHDPIEREERTAAVVTTCEAEVKFLESLSE